MHPAEALQTAVYSTLANNAGMISALGAPPPVYSNVPDGATLPYAQIDTPSSADWSHNTAYGHQQRFDVHVWGELTGTAGGKSKVLSVMDAIVKALRDASLNLTDHTLVLIHFENDTGVMTDPDGRTLHGVVSFRALTQES